MPGSVRGCVVTSRPCCVQSSPAAVPPERRASSTMAVSRAKSLREGCWLHLTLKNHVHTTLTHMNGSDERREEGMFISPHLFSLSHFYINTTPTFQNIPLCTMSFFVERLRSCQCSGGTLCVFIYFLMQLWN